MEILFESRYHCFHKLSLLPNGKQLAPVHDAKHAYSKKNYSFVKPFSSWLSEIQVNAVEKSANCNKKINSD